MTLKGAIFGGLAAMLLLTQAQAQTPAIGGPCAAAVGPSVRFDDDTHRRWYRRFWTGDCSGLWFCQAGEPNWNAGTTKFTATAAPDKRSALTQRFCDVGHMIGHEWARDNGVRKIDTKALEGFYKTLSSNQGDIQARLDTVEASARKMLGR